MYTRNSRRRTSTHKMRSHYLGLGQLYIRQILAQSTDLPSVAWYEKLIGDFETRSCTAELLESLEYNEPSEIKTVP